MFERFEGNQQNDELLKALDEIDDPDKYLEEIDEAIQELEERDRREILRMLQGSIEKTKIISDQVYDVFDEPKRVAEQVARVMSETTDDYKKILERIYVMKRRMRGGELQ